LLPFPDRSRYVLPLVSAVSKLQNPIAPVGSEAVTVALLTVTLTAADVVVAPAELRAIAEMLWVPLATPVVFHATEYGAVVTSAPTFTPSTWNCTPTAPVALAVMVVVPDNVAPPAGAVIDTDVATLFTVTLTAADVVFAPDESRAIAVSECAAFVAVFVSHEIVYGAVVTSAPTLTPSTWNCTVPVAAPGVTWAVKVTASPRFDGFFDELTVVVLVALVTVCANGAEVLPLKLVSPA
jgi:hypothetical protein